MKTRKLKIQCFDCIGQISTFTVDENGAQNSPSFKSFADLMQWALIPANYAFLIEMRVTNNLF